MLKIDSLKTPAYICQESLLEQNLKILNDLDIIPYEKGKKFIIKIAINGKLKIYYELSANKVLRVENNPVY